MLTDGVPWQGLAVVARSLATWWRIEDQHASLRAIDPPGALAAAVHRLVAQRAGDRSTFRAAAKAYRADEATVRRADSRIRRHLELGPGSCW